MRFYYQNFGLQSKEYVLGAEWLKDLNIMFAHIHCHVFFTVKKKIGYFNFFNVTLPTKKEKKIYIGYGFKVISDYVMKATNSLP